MYFENIIGQDFAKKYLTNSIKKINLIMRICLREWME